MGNVASAILMYALEAAWVFQRLIDQDYRQNHGGRLKPIASLVKVEDEHEVFLPNGASTPMLSRSPHHHSKPAPLHKAKHAPRPHRTGRHKKTRSEPFRMVPVPKPRRFSPCREPTEITAAMCGCSVAADTQHWVTCHAKTSGATLRRAFSDINLPQHEPRATEDAALPVHFAGGGGGGGVALKLVVSRGYTTDPCDDFAIRPLRSE